MKPRTLLTTAALIAAALFILDVPAAMAADNNFVGSGGGGDNTSWEDSSNWSGGVPDDTDNVIIGSLYSVDLDQGDGLADSFDIDGTLDIAAGRTLTVDGSGDNSHALDGTINIYGDAQSNGGVLSFTTTATQTITGSGTIDLHYYDSTTPANSASILIASGVTLGVYPTVCGSGIIRGDGSYTNNGLLDANDVDGTLSVAIGTTLEDTAASHATRYQVSATGAVLHFDSAITTATGLEGRFVMTVAGTLDFDEPVTSEGRLQLSAGTVYVDAIVTLGDQEDEEFMLFTGGTINVSATHTFTHY